MAAPCFALNHAFAAAASFLLICRGRRDIFWFQRRAGPELVEHKRFKLAATILKAAKTGRKESIYGLPLRSYVLENKVSRLYPADLESLKKPG